MSTTFGILGRVPGAIVSFSKARITRQRCAGVECGVPSLPILTF